MPPRFSPDNSLEARALRVAVAQGIAVDHALAYLKLQIPVINNVVRVEFRPEPPEDICA